MTVAEYPASNKSEGINAAKAIFIAGRDSHGDGEHEHQAGAKLLSKVLREQQAGFETVNVYGGWPKDESVFEGVNAIVLYCDGGSNHVINEYLESFNALVDSGVGVVALHYGVEVPKDSAASQAMLRAIGGYFETHWSVNPFWEADYVSLAKHPIAEGVSPFKLYDEWYFNMRFMPAGVVPVLMAVPPASTMDRWNGAHSGNDSVRKMVAAKLPQVTAWAFDRPDGGRGFAYTGGHYHKNWEDRNALQLVLNAIVWVASGSKPKSAVAPLAVNE